MSKRSKTFKYQDSKCVTGRGKGGSPRVNVRFPGTEMFCCLDLTFLPGERLQPGTRFDVECVFLLPQSKCPPSGESSASPEGQANPAALRNHAGSNQLGTADLNTL